MFVVGTDVRRRTHTFVPVDQAGRQLGQVAVTPDAKGHDKSIRRASEQFGEELTWGIEDCRHLSSVLEAGLRDAGQVVVRVPSRRRAKQFHTARTRGNSGAIDALAVARAVTRETDLPQASHDDTSRGQTLLIDPGDSLVRRRTAGRVRSNRAGNRQLNAAPHCIAITQIRPKDSLRRTYDNKRLAVGDSEAGALRSLKRRLARIVFNTLANNQKTAPARPIADAA